MAAGMRVLSTATSAASELVQVERRGAHVAVVTLNRPAKLNALSVPMFRAIRDAAARVRAERDVRAVVLRGAGRAFCAGLDVKSLMRDPFGTPSAIDELLTTDRDTGATIAQQVCVAWRSLPAPVIAVVHGATFGGGLQLALGADFRFGAEDAKLSVMESKWGLVPDMGGTLALRELVRLDVALELAMSARTVGAHEAVQLGLLTRVCAQPEAEAFALADALAERSPDCIAATKALFRANYAHGAGADERASLEREARLQRALLGKWNQLIASAKGAGLPLAGQLAYLTRAAGWADELAPAPSAADADVAQPEEAEAEQQRDPGSDAADARGADTGSGAARPNGNM